MTFDPFREHSRPIEQIKAELATAEEKQATTLCKHIMELEQQVTWLTDRVCTLIANAGDNRER